MSNFLESKKIKIVLIVLASLIVILVVFGLGITIGYDRANFTSHFDQNYYHNFNPGAPAGPMSEHGISGTVIDVSSSSISVQDPANNEHSIAIAPDTVIREMDNTILITDVKIGDQIVVIGEPNPQGQVYARFIRVFAASSSMPTPQGQ
jgi:hypothetical protein